MVHRARCWWLCCATYCAAFLAAPACAEQLDVQRLAASVFRVEAREDSGRLHLGSGVLVGPGALVTNCHTLRTAQTIHVMGATTRHTATVLRADAVRDLCLLDVPNLKGNAVVLGNTTDKQPGDPLLAVGFPAGASLTVSRGHVEGLFTYQGRGRVVQGSAHFTFGKSGGALFDERGRLIGILTFKCRGGGPYHFSVPVEWVTKLMDDGPHSTVLTGEKPFWQYTDDRQPMFLRAATLLAQGECSPLKSLAAQWVAREPGNPEAAFMANRAQMCDLLEIRQRPLLEN